jgi:tRNA G26 N,N-dimethylase Trm1
MWSGVIHDSDFVTRVLDHIENTQKKYGTSPRMKGMLTVAKEVRILDAWRQLYDRFTCRKSIRLSTSRRPV